MVLGLYSNRAGRLSDLKLMIEKALQENMGPSVGQILKAARLARDLTLEAVAKSLRISKRHLLLFEEDNETLICDVYTLGFLRSYAQYLGLDKEDIIQMFKNKATSPQPSQFIFPGPLPERGMPSSRILGLSLFVLLVIIIIGGWFGYYSSIPYFQEEAALVEPNVKIEEFLPSHESANLSLEQSPPQTAVSLEKTSLDENQASALPISPPITGVFLKTTEKAWIEVTDKEGNIILSRLFEPGESYEFKNTQNLFLKTGNTGGTHLSFGERIYPLSKTSGTITSNIPLDSKKWVDQSPETH